MNLLKNLLLTSLICLLSNISDAESQLLSYQSEYNISLGKTDNEKRLPGRTYINEASGYLLVDWVDNCQESWLTNQRMMTKFINSHGVGSVSEINYSLNELIDGSKMEFVLEVKEDAEVVDRHYGKAEKKDDLIVKFLDRDKVLNFSGDVVFPHQFLEEIINNFNSEEKMLVKKVYEGTIPDKFFNVSVFFTDDEVSVNENVLPEGVINKFKKIRMAYYQDKLQTPIFEQTVHLNIQGIASFFRYDYPDYSLELDLKKLKLTSLSCN